MKKLMVALAAVATAFGLYADTPSYTALPGGSDFENGTLDTTYWKSSVDGAATVVEDSHGISETDIRRSAEYKASDDLKLLKLATKLGNPVTNNVLSTGVAKEIPADNLCYDALVNFTVFDAGDDQIPAADFVDAKLAVYLQLASEADNAATNLYVYAKNGGTPQAFQCATVVTPGWHRLTIKAIADIGGKQPGFVVFIDGAAVTSQDAQLTGAAAAALNVIAASYNKDGALFVSTSTAAEITSVCFDGQGSVDEAYFATGSVAAFTDDPATFTLAIGADIESFTATYGDQVKTWTSGSPAPEFVFGAAGKLVLSNVECANGKFLKTTEFTVDGNTITIPNAVVPVASIDAKLYDDLNEAVAAAADKTLKLLANATNLTIAASMTLDLNARTIAGFSTEEDVEIVLTNSAVTDAIVSGDATMAEGAINVTSIKFDYDSNMAPLPSEGCGLIFDLICGAADYEFVQGTGADSIYWVLQPKPTEVDTPTANVLTYNGNEQTGVANDADKYESISGNTAKNAGSYEAVIKLKSGYVWKDKTFDGKVPWSIAKVAVTVTADPKTMKAGEALPAFTYQITSGELVDGETLTGTLTVNTDGKTAGEFDIVQENDWANANYNVTYVGAKLTVEKAEEPVPENMNGASKDQKDAYTAWVAGLKEQGIIIDTTDDATAIAFALSMTDEDLKGYDTVEKAVEAMLATKITPEMVAAIAAGGLDKDGKLNETTFQTLEGNYVNAVFTFVTATELESTDTAKFYHLSADFKPAND